MAIFTLIQPRTSTNLFLIPNADGCNIDLTPIGDTDNWKCVDDPVAVPDNDITYNYSSSPTLKYDLYSLPNHTTEIGAINYVQVFARAKSQTFPQHEDGIYKIIITDDACSNIYKSDDINLTASTYKTYSKVLTENPRTASAWTWSNIDDLQIGLECNSPLLDYAPTTLTIRPHDCVVCNLLPSYGLQNDQALLIDEEVEDGFDTWIAVSGEDTDYSLFHLTNHVIGSGVITNVTIFVCVNPIAKPDDNYCQTLIRTHANDYYGTVAYLPRDAWTYTTTSYANNPNTSNAWTWAEIDDLQGGIRLHAIADSACYCTQIYIVVSYNPEVYPEIRTTQEYAVVNYTPIDEECVLNKPEKISVNHSMNVKMLNFWNGTREVYSLNRSGKSIVLTGSEYQSDTCNKGCPCEHITCVDGMGKDGSTITISGLRNLFNGDYKIRSFGWKHISKKPESYDWILELEYAD